MEERKEDIGKLSYKQRIDKFINENNNLNKEIKKK